MGTRSPQSTPFVHNLGTLHAGQQIIISGMPRSNASRFNISFDNSPNGPGSSDTAFVYDVRFNFGTDKQVIVRNSQQYGCWGHEERAIPHFPFQTEKFFEITVNIFRGGFRVCVNSGDVMEFKHRYKEQPLPKFCYLRIDGDVQLSKVAFKQ
ncbi:LEG4-like protein [Mya arenaria]|uniref:Galectin n=1 Tax=Mya arenaria TaxID=6604 RepID=A0ABY7G4M0_MYAAR|nr:LEG4-like protein [Mya arenaria]